ncbi:MAG: hypothetical protein ACAH83_14760 [Alphaproteobacteria bacterium]
MKQNRRRGVVHNLHVRHDPGEKFSKIEKQFPQDGGRFAEPQMQTAASGCGGLLSIRGEREGDEETSDFDIFRFLASPVHSNARPKELFLAFDYFCQAKKGPKYKPPPKRAAVCFQSGGKEKETKKTSDFDIFRFLASPVHSNARANELFRGFDYFCTAKKKAQNNRPPRQGAAVCSIRGEREWRPRGF